MKISEQNLKYLVKDFSLPITIFKAPYFNHFMDLFDEHFETWDKHQAMKFVLMQLGDEGFHALSSQIRNESIQMISDSEGYRNFLALDLTYLEPIKMIKSDKLYTEANAGERFTSIDLVKANFQSFLYSQSDFWDQFDATTYEDFLINNFSVSGSYFIESKKIRQVIFGNLNPKRQQAIQRYIMKQINTYLIDKYGLSEEHIKIASSDEIVFEGGWDLDPSELTKNIKEKIGYDVRVEQFTLNQYGTESYEFFVKDFPDHQVIKGVEGSYIAEVVRYLKNEPPNPLDRYYFQNGRISSYQDDLFGRNL